MNFYQLNFYKNASKEVNLEFSGNIRDTDIARYH
jgi:hypothetical protein